MKHKITIWLAAIFVLAIILAACGPNLPPIIPPSATLTTSPSVTPTPRPTPVPLPPTIVETVPPVGSQISLQSMLTIYFSEKMDRASVETGLRADFPGGFVFSWMDDYSLSLTPKSALPSASQVTFTLAATARSLSGFSLLAPISFSYETPGPLGVAQVLPEAHSREVSPDSAVVVSFDQPVVPLGADPASLPAGFSLDPVTPGQGEWLNTSTYSFHGEPALFGGTQYTVRVNPALTSTAGMPLEAAGSNNVWAFSTSLPRVDHIVAVNPETQTSASDSAAQEIGDFDVLPDSLIEIAFNQPMDQASVEANLSVIGPGGRVAGSFEWNEKSSVLKFKPTAMLQRDTTYLAALSGLARSKGGVTLGTDSTKSLRTVRAFGVLSTSFPSGETRPHDKYVTITFTAPLAKYSDAELRDLILIKPEITDRSPYVDDTEIRMYSGFLPGQHYSITFSSHLKDRYGQELGRDFVFSFNEPDSSPNLQPVSYSPVLFNLPVDPTISMQAVNLDTLHVSRGSMSLADFLRYQTDYEFQDKYTPEELNTWSVPLDMPLNINRTISVKLSDGPLTPGLYFTRINSPESSYQHGYNSLLVISNVNLTFKLGATEALLWAMDWRTHAPIAHRSFALYDEEGKIFLNAATDENGFWRGPISYSAEKSYSGAYAILGRPGEDQFGVARSSWQSGVGMGDYEFWPNVAGPTTWAYLYSDRPIYRPGDTVHVRGILNQRFDGRYQDAGVEAVTVALNHYDQMTNVDDKVGEQEMTLSGYGTFNGDFSLPAVAAPGTYYISVKANETGDYVGGLSVKVADYRKPEINLTVTIDPPEAKSGQPLTATIDAEYFFGGPAADLPFTWRLYSSTSRFSIPRFTTGLQVTGRLPLGERGRFGNVSREGKGRTNADGTFSLTLGDIQVDDTSGLTLEVTASESGGFPISARTSATIHPETFYVGVRPSAWVGQAGMELDFSLYSVDWDKRPVSRSLQVDFKKIRWERNDAGYYNYYTFTPVYTPLYSKSVATAENGQANVAFTPPEAGTYVLDVTFAGAHTQALVWVAGSDSAMWPNLPYQEVQLTADQENYKPGETAQVFIPNPFNAYVPALLTTERGTIKSAEVISIPPEGYTFQRPLIEADAPNIYVSATLLGPSGVDFRQGYINLPVDPGALTLNVEVKATPAKAKPGDTLTLDLTVTDSKGHPVVGEFSLAVVDLAVLALAEPNSEDIVPAYYDIQRLNIVTGLTAAVYANRWSPGGGGRGGGGGEEILMLRSKFQDTAYWKADIVTDSQGKGQVNLRLPDNLTTWQVDTRGLSADTRVGQARLQVVSTKDLLIRPQTQRFFVAGDHAELAAMVNNNTAQALNATVGLQVTGFLLDEPAEAQQMLTVPANGSVRIAWSGQVQAVDSVDPVFSASSGALQDATRPVDGAIPVLRYSAPQTFSTAGILKGASTHQEIIAVPRSFEPLGGNLTVELSPSMAAVILSSLKALESAEEPWCSEQIVSSLLPNVVTYRTLQASGLEDPALTARLQENLKNDLSHLLAYQAEEGGFKWTTSSGKTDPYLTAYVLFGLGQVSASGLDVGNVDIAGAMEKARAYFQSLDSYFNVEELKNPDRLNRVSFILYAMDTTGGLDRLDYLPGLIYGPDYQNKLDPWAQALLALTFTQRSSSDERAAALMNNLQTTAIRSATGAHWESASGSWMNPATPLFTTAIVIHALAERDASTPLLADAVRYLALQQNPDGRWASTYETTWVILALNNFMQGTGELNGNFAFSAALNGASLAQGQASGPQNLVSVTTRAALTGLNLTGANSLLVSRVDGPGSLYYRAALSVDRPVESAPALDRGIAISRQFLDCSGETCQPVSSYQMKPDLSGRVSVKLTITLPHEAYYLMVQDAIPAGSDILDSSLKTSQQGEQSISVQAQYDPSDPFREGWGWWYFNKPQIYPDHILWSAEYLPTGTYELTYTIIPSLAGQYRVLPAHAWQAYFPEVQGTSAGDVFEIKP